MAAKCAYHLGCHVCVENWKILRDDGKRFLAAEEKDARLLMVNTIKTLVDVAEVFLTSTDNTKEG